MEKPLVSLIVLSYNSEKFILDALDSVRDQTYQPIELIITDDRSSDSTCDLAQKWAAMNRERFVSVTFITSATNTGVSINANRGLNVANGDWVKFLAGDDALEPTAIEELIIFASSEKGTIVVHGNRKVYRRDFQEANLIDQSSMSEHIYNHPDISPEQQLQIMLRKNYVSAPTLFFKTLTLREVGGFVESVPMIEDIPILLKLSANGIRIRHLNKFISKYRVHDNSITRIKGKLPVANYLIQTLEHKLNVYGERMPTFRWIGQSLQLYSLRFCNMLTGLLDRINPGFLGRMAHKCSSVLLACFSRYNQWSEKRLSKEIESMIKSTKAL
ncbi:glycosyltransferase [Pirellulaceae bacterium SH449]